MLRMEGELHYTREKIFFFFYIIRVEGEFEFGK